MKDSFTDASESTTPPSSSGPVCAQEREKKNFSPHVLDFPRTEDQRVYHVGIRAGEVANRIVSYQLLVEREGVFEHALLVNEKEKKDI